ncbi:MAG: hypothetical protein ACRDV4_02120, partial [Acidimicrobiales bacterium]
MRSWLWARRLGLRVAAAIAALVVVGLGIGSCSAPARSSEGASAARAASLPDPLATSIDTGSGEWVTLPMGHLDQPLNTFWQLFFKPFGSG